MPDCTKGKIEPQHLSINIHQLIPTLMVSFPPYKDHANENLSTKVVKRKLQSSTLLKQWCMTVGTSGDNFSQDPEVTSALKT